MRNVFFTISSWNYLHYSRTVASSFARHHPDFSCVIAICDTPRSDFGKISLRCPTRAVAIGGGCRHQIYEKSSRAGVIGGAIHEGQRCIQMDALAEWAISYRFRVHVLHRGWNDRTAQDSQSVARAFSRCCYRNRYKSAERGTWACYCL